MCTSSDQLYCFREVPASTLTFSSLSAVIAALSEPPYIDDVEDIWIIGGASVYKVGTRIVIQHIMYNYVSISDVGSDGAPTV